jgi:hypothetical protein
VTRMQALAKMCECVLEFEYTFPIAAQHGKKVDLTSAVKFVTYLFAKALA